MSILGYRFEKRTNCPFRHDVYGHRCNLKQIDGMRKEEDIHCGLTVDLESSDIPKDCPLKEGAITIGLIERKYEDQKQLVDKVFNMLTAYVEMIEEER